MSDELRDEELRDEYDFDYAQARPNRFAAGLVKGGRLVVLDPEVAAVFRGSEDVNSVLRALIKTMPVRSEPKVSAADAADTDR